MLKLNCLNCNKEILIPPCLIKRGAGKFCSHSCKGKFWAKKQEIFNIGHPQFNTGRTHFKRGESRVVSQDQRRKISKAHKGLPRPNRKGKNCYLWKGGITEENHKIRTSIEFKLWRDAVFARDNWTCQKCGKRGGIIHAHHIKSFKGFPELRTAINNGSTLCAKCHKGGHYGIRK